ncbi:MAG: hypothetical protein ABI904_12540 [Chloroflexota bacterium]
MPKKFYTEKDIEDLVHSGVKSLEVCDDVVLTELAYERAKRLGFQLITDRADNPPAAPVRPYLSEKKPVQAQPVTASVSSAESQPALTPALYPKGHTSQGERGTDIESRIRSAVIAKLGDQVDAKLLDNIIHRVVKATGLK